MKKIIQVPIHSLIATLFVVNVAFIAIAIHYYNDQFLIWRYPFSYAGRAYTEMGSYNHLGMVIYSTSMLLSALIVLAIGYNLYLETVENQHSAKFGLFLICALGFLIAAFSPDDIRHNSHVLGSALAVASLWLAANLYLLEVRTTLTRQQYLGAQSLLQVPIIVYAITYFFDIFPLSIQMQKLAILSLGFMLYYTTKKEEYNKNN